MSFVCRVGALLSAGVWLGISLQVQAATVMLDLPAQSLQSALVQLSERVGIQMMVDAALVADVISPPLQGDHSIDSALSELLAGAGLVYRHVGERTILIERQQQDVRVIGAVQVQGIRNAPARGANGSRDINATEGSDSYAARGASVGSPFPQVLK
jgi:outer membrane receptor for ferric coprogen and ferric-rhodotorulic acid